jgi:putative N6-adenine-specific DNA methylase
VPRPLELDLFVACAPGLEPWLARELSDLGVESPAAVAGGVECRGDARMLFAVNLGSGLASHVLVRLASFHARRLPELRRKADNLAWGDWLLPGEACAVRVACRRSRLYHTGAVAERIGLALAAATGAATDADPESGAPVVHVRLFEDTCTISLDTSGAPLHRRGYREFGAKAPLREDLARALVLASGWDPGTPFCDPLCGSGTIAIEAALLARRLPVGWRRGFAFERTGLFEPEAFADVREGLLARSLPAAPAPIRGSDRDRGAIVGARANADRAGVGADVEFAVAAVRDAPGLRAADAPAGAVVANPPYGRRIGAARNLTPLYQSLGQACTALPPAWRVALCASDRRLALKTGLALETAFLTSHGGVKVRALVGAAGRPR